MNWSKLACHAFVKTFSLLIIPFSVVASKADLVTKLLQNWSLGIMLSDFGPTNYIYDSRYQANIYWLP